MTIVVVYDFHVIVFEIEVKIFQNIIK